MSRASRPVLSALVVTLVWILVSGLVVGPPTAEAASYKTPTKLKVVATAGTSVRLTWKAVSKATRYRIKYDDNSKLSSPAYAHASGTSVDLKKLKPNTTYWVSVVVTNSKDKTLSKYSKKLKFKTAAAAVTSFPPSSLKSVSTASTALRVSWAKTAGAARYQVKYSTKSSMTSARFAYSYGTTVELTKLKAKTTYYVQVSALNAKGAKVSQYSTKLKLKTRAKSSYTQLSPTGLSAAATSAGSATLNWSTRGSTNRYKIKLSTSSSFSNAKWYVSTGTNHTIAGLVASTKYYAQVRVSDSKGGDLSEYSSAVSFTTAKLGTVAPPSGLTATASTPDSITVKWNAIPGAAAYRIKYDATPWTASKYVFTTGTSATLKGLLKNTTYSIKVRLVDAKDRDLSTYGATIRITTPLKATSSPASVKPVAIPDVPPTGLTATRSGSTVTLKWNAIAAAPQYRVKYDTNPWKTPQYASTTTNSITLKGLTGNQTYSFKVRVMDAAGKFPTGYGSTVTVTIPAQPVPLRAASYNVRCHNCSSGLAEEKPWTTRRTAIVAAVKAEDPDVVGLQEAQQSWLLDADGDAINKSQFEDLVERLGNPWALTNPARNNCVKSTTPTNCTFKDQGASKGTKIIYRTDRLTLVSSGTVELSRLKSGSYERYLAWAVFEQKSTGKRFFFGDTHLEPDNDSGSSTTYHDHRARQARDVLAAIAAKNTAKLPVVLVGDLASSTADKPTNAPYDVLTTGGLVDPLGNVKGVSAPVNPTVETRVNTNYYSFNGWARQARRTTTKVNGVYTDYILTSPGMRVEEFEQVVNVDSAGKFIGVIPSDHNMLTAKLWLVPSTANN